MSPRRSFVAVACGLMLACGAMRSAAEVPLVQQGSSMRWLANSRDPRLGTSWTAESFDDAAWSGGLYGVGYENGTGALALVQTPVPSGTLSVYTRSTFTIADAASVQSLILGADWDDGCAAWINGVEVWRSQEMPVGTLAWDSTPRAHESSNAPAPRYGAGHDVTALALPVLHAGVNVLAVGVWNDQAASSDLVLVPQLVMNRLLAITRGPYLQMATPDSMVVRWRTNRATDSRVAWGPAPGGLGDELVDAASVNDHVVRVTGLTPATSYAYSVGTSSQVLAGDDAAHAFRTPPPVGTASPLRLWVIGDSGTANANAARVRDAYRTVTGAARTDAWLMLGDNAYENGTDDDYQGAVFDMYPEMLGTAPLWPTLGNHDALSADSATQSGVYYDTFTLPAGGEAGGTPSGTEAYYSFDIANAHFVCLDSQGSSRSPGSPMLRWLQADLASTSQEWLIAFWHHPPYSKGSHDSDTETELVQMRQNVMPILEAGGVDLVLSGHSHCYERSHLIDGHYGLSTTFGPANLVDGGDGQVDGDGAYRKPATGLSPRAGDVCVVAGSSGKLETGGTLDHPVMATSLLEMGSVVLTLRSRRLDVQFVDDAAALRDHFTITKGPVVTAESLCHDGLDDDADGLVDCADADCATVDADADGHPDCSDCAPDDATSWSLPAEIARLTVVRVARATDAALGWSGAAPPAGSAAGYDVATGRLSELRADRGFGRASCLARDVAAQGVTDARLTGASGDGWWYLVRERDACGAGTWGTGSSGRARVLAPACD